MPPRNVRHIWNRFDISNAGSKRPRQVWIWSNILFVLSCPLVWGHGETNDVLIQLNEQIQQQPDDIDLILKRARLQIRLQRGEAALVDLHRLRVEQPENLEFVFLTGQAFKQSGNLEAAESHFRSYLARQPRAAKVLVNLSEVLTSQGRHRDAAEMWDRVVQVQVPPLPGHYLRRAQAYRDANDIHTAIEGLDESLDQLGPLVSIQKYAIELTIESGNPHQAIQRIDNLVAQLPRKESWLLRKAELLVQISAFEKAEEELRLARNALAALPATISKTPAGRDLKRRIDEVQIQLNTFAESMK